MKNYALLRKTMEHIEAHPEEHDQGYWMTRNRSGTCCTTACFAGTAVLLSHEKAMPLWCDLLGNEAAQVSVDGLAKSIMHLAKDELGLNHDEASQLFAGGNSMSTLRSLVDTFLAEEATQ